MRFLTVLQIILQAIAAVVNSDRYMNSYTQSIYHLLCLCTSMYNGIAFTSYSQVYGTVYLELLLCAS